MMRNLVACLSGLFAPSGYEDAVRTFIRDKAAESADFVKEDALGNLIVLKKGKKPTARPIVLAAYMDEPGMMVKDVTEEGLVKFGIVGGTAPGAILGKQVLVGESALHGVIGLKPIHLTPAEERKTLPKTKDLYIDLGAESGAFTKQHVEQGDYGVFYGPVLPMGGQTNGKAMGRSVTCAVLLTLMQQPLPVDVTFVFTTQRQVGSRGAFGAGFGVKAGAVVVLDLCPGSDGDDKLPVLGKGPVAPAMDSGCMYDKMLMETLRCAAGEGNVQVLGKAEVSSDAAAFQRAGEGAKTAALMCPAKYISAPCQMIDMRDAEKMTGVLMEFLKEMEGKPL